MADVFTQTNRMLAQYAEQHESILVGYSGGKDSLCVLDLCMKHFKRVECFFWYVIPGLRYTEGPLEFARQRWGVTIHQYPHWVVFKLIKYGIYSPCYFQNWDLPEFSVLDCYQLAMADTGIDVIAHGAKKADSMWRRRNLSGMKVHDYLIYPVLEWNKFEVLAYLKMHNIPLPESSGRSATGVDLTTPSLLFLHDNYPDDFEKLERVFPYIRAAVHRRDWYGID